MAFHYDVNNAAITGPQAVFKLKTLLVAAGWVVRSSGDSLSAFSSSGDVITSGNTGAGGLGNGTAWFVIEMPTMNGVNRQLMFERSNDTSWVIKYSYSAHFSGGSASVPATATDSISLSNGFSIFPGNSTYRWNAAADDAAPYGFWASQFAIGGGNPNGCICMFPLNQTDPSDADPYVFYISIVTSTFSAGSDLAGGGNGLAAYFRKGLTGERFNSAFTSGVPTWCFSFYNGSSTIPNNVGPNPHNGNDDVFDIPVGSPGQVISGEARWPGGFKGMCSFMKWNGSSRTTGDTLSISSPGAKDRIVYRDVNLPWNGSTPTI